MKKTTMTKKLASQLVGTRTKSARQVADALSSPSLKGSKAYQLEREIKLTQFAIEDPNGSFVECQDCCFMEQRPRHLVFGRGRTCPECDGELVWHALQDGKLLV